METTKTNTYKGHARVDIADVLRGLAVMGIVILHSIEHFNFYSFPDTAGQAGWLNFTDVFFLLQFAFCRWWMSRHTHGPLEYLWKRAT